MSEEGNRTEECPKIRNDREKYGARGISNVWGRSPTESDLIDIYKEHGKATKAQKYEQRKMEETEKKRRKARGKAARIKQIKERIGLVDKSSESEASSPDSEDRKKKKNRKEKKEHRKQKRKHRHSSGSEAESSENVKNKKIARTGGKASDSDNDWVPLTKNMIAEKLQRAKEEEAEIIGPLVPEHLIKKYDTPAQWDFKNDPSVEKDMLRGEAESMAAYYAQGKRIPRRGEIGLSSEEISTFERAGYVMSGTRHKAMEATRLRKENQIMTAEEKRMLSGFTHEQRKQKEDVIHQRMRTLIDSKKSKV